MVRSQKAHIVILPESKLKVVPDRVVREIWGRRNVKWVAIDAVGAASGLLTIWDTHLVSVVKSWKDVFSLSVLVEDLTNNSKWLLTSVYGPNNGQRRDDFWKELDTIRGRWNGAWCIGGDLNINRFPSEKLGGSKLTAEMRRFFDWINSHNLVDLQLGGASFIWSNHQSSPAMSIG